VNSIDFKPFIVILMGPPGSGKGTHAGPLSAQLNIPHISTGDLFRENIRNQTIMGQEASRYIEKGNLVPDELVLDMLFNRVSKKDCEQGYILDGFPRTIAQAKALDKRLQGAQVIALNLNLSDRVIVERITGRIACKGCGKPYHKKYAPPAVPYTCDTCQLTLIQREDDREEIILKRLEVYRMQTEPLIAYYKGQPGVLFEIDSEKERSDVFQDILEVLPLSATP
jgi:adenylate kinase